MRFELPEAAFRKLCRLVKQRDEELAETYQSIIGEWPPSRGEVHHAKHAGSGGPDKEDNLSGHWIVQSGDRKERVIIEWQS